jgi:ribosomal protein S8
MFQSKIPHILVLLLISIEIGCGESESTTDRADPPTPDNSSTVDAERTDARGGTETVDSTTKGDGDTGELREVVAEGIGLTPEDALKNAFSRAVESAIGVLVDSTTVVKNDKLIRDEVLTLSNGYIQSYDELSRDKQRGLTSVRIKAQVKVEPLVSRLRELSITGKRKVDGASLAAEYTTKKRRSTDAKSMLQEVTRRFPVSVLSIKAGKPRVGEDGSGDVMLTVPVTVTVDPDKYRDFDTGFRRVLKTLARREQKQYQLEPIHLQSFGAGRVEVENIGRLASHSGFAVSDGVPLYTHWISIHKKHHGFGIGGGSDRIEPLETIGVLLFDRADKRLRRTSWTMFDIDKEFLDLFASAPRQVLDITVKLLDAKTRILSEARGSGLFSQTLFSNGDRREKTIGVLGGIGQTLSNRAEVTTNVNLCIPGAFESYYGSRPPHNPGLRIFPVGPYFYYHLYWNGAGAFSPEVRFSVPFTLTQDELSRLDTIECELELQPGNTMLKTESPQSPIGRRGR